MDRVPDRPHVLLLHAAVVAGEQHAPLRERHEHRVVHPQLDGQLHRAASVIVANGFDVGLQIAQNGGRLVRFEAGGPEVRRETDLEHVGLFLRGAEGLRVRTAKGDVGGIERVPHGGIGVAGAERLDVETGDPREVRERRHVHDRHAGDPGPGHRVEELAHPRRAVLGFLHREGDEVEIRGVRFPGGGARQAARELAGIDLHEVVPTLHRHPYPLPFPVDELGFVGEADEGRGMARRAELDAEQRPVRGAHDHDVVHPFLRTIRGAADEPADRYSLTRRLRPPPRGPRAGCGAGAGSGSKRLARISHQLSSRGRQDAAVTRRTDRKALKA